MTITEELVKKVITTVNSGLTKGLGEPLPGKMCVEAAVSYALGLPHSDQPKCVGYAVREAKIRLNDANWTSEQSRAKGLLKLSIAQLGSDELDQVEFTTRLVRETIRVIVPIALRAACINSQKAVELEECAKLCETKPTKESALIAFYAVNTVHAANIIHAAYIATTYTTATTAYAAVSYAAHAALTIANASSNPDKVLTIFADLMLAVLVEMKSPGCKWLWMVEQKEELNSSRAEEAL